jgi:Tol biopolymer transport system component
VQPRIAPHGEHLAFHTAQAQQDIWIYDLVRRNVTRLTKEGRNATPVWSPDGRRIVYRSSITGPDNLFWLPVDAKVPPQRLTTTSEHEVPAAWSSDGDVLAFYRLTDTEVELWTLSVDGDGTAKKIMGATNAQGGADFSPDGKWVAYATTETGRWEVYVEAFPSGTRRQQVSTDGGMSPVWRHDGRELFFVSAGSDPDESSSLRMMATAVSIGPVPRFGAPRLLFEGPYESSYPARGYDVAPDGRHFVLAQREQTPAVPLKGIVLVQNWFEELKAKVPVGK